MGVKGLSTFLKENNYKINIQKEVLDWKRNNSNAKPIIAIDLYGFCTHVTSEFKDDLVFGGRPLEVLNRFTNILDELKHFGCQLEFFADYNIQETKKDEWMRRRDEECALSGQFYAWLDEGHTFQEMKNKKHDFQIFVKSLCYPMELRARDRGTMHYAWLHECDHEIIKYATKNNVLAILSADSDFMIFDGNYRLWSSEIFLQNGEIFTYEYDRKMFTKKYGLSVKQLPLFASLLGSDITKEFSFKLRTFQKYLTNSNENCKIAETAKYVRTFGEKLLPKDFARISKAIFGFDNNIKFKKILSQSIEWYDKELFVHLRPVGDPMTEKIRSTIHYPAYISVMSNIQGINICNFDVRVQTDTNNLPKLFSEWTKKRVGVLRKNLNDSRYLLTLLARNGLSQKFICYQDFPIYPEFKIPHLPDLYLGDDAYNDTRYEILGWIMTLPDDIICKIKTLPLVMRIRAVSVHALVQNKWIEPFEGDAILHTELTFLKNMKCSVKYPVMLIQRHIRIAHMYIATFAQVRQNFEIAGFHANMTALISRFDGVFFNELMARVDKMTLNDRKTLFEPIERYILYAK